MQINGQQYKIIRSKQIEVRGNVRTVLTLQKPNGEKLYEAVVYENGTVSSVA